MFVATATKARKKKKMLVWGIVLIVAAAVVISTFFGKGNQNALTIRTTTLAPMTLSNTVSATGSVESSDDYKVYSTLGSLVSQVNVKVGDKVEAGQVLAMLDTETLELNIAQSEANINHAKSTAAQQIKQAEKNLNNARKNLEEGLNSSVISAESGVDSAQINQQNAALTLQTAEDNQEATQDMIGSYRDSYNDARSDYLSAQSQYEKARRAYNEARQGVNSDIIDSLNRQIDNTQAGYQNKLKEVGEKQTALTEAETTFEANKLLLENLIAAAGDNPTDEQQEKINEASDRVSQDESNVAEAKKVYDEVLGEATALKDEIASLKSQLSDYEESFGITEAAKALEAATQIKDSMEAAMLSARSRLESTRTQADQADTALDQAELSKKSADTSYETSLKQQQATLEGINQQIESYEDALISSRIQADTTAQEISLQLLYKQLEDSTITAPISGVVTAVNAEEGAPASGVLFIIQNVDQLEISTSIKEYDVTSVKEGLPVTIRTDAIDGEEFEGVLSEIAPTGSKGASGSGAVTFAAKVSIPKPGALRVGMNTRMDIILEEKENVFSVPFDALHTAEDGSNYIISVVANESQEKNALPYITKNIPVTTGLETDFYIEIISDQLTEGMQIIPTSDEYAEGTPVQVM